MENECKDTCDCGFCDCDEKSREELFKQTSEHIKEYGFESVGVDDGPINFVYSVGFTELDHPEIIIFSLRPDISHYLLTDIYQRISKGKKYEEDVIDNDLGNLPCTFKKVVDKDAIDVFFGFGKEYYELQGKNISAMAFVWCDNNKKFPWEDGFESEFLPRQIPIWDTPEKIKEWKILCQSEENVDIVEE